MARLWFSLVVLICSFYEILHSYAAIVTHTLTGCDSRMYRLHNNADIMHLTVLIKQ